MRLTAVRTAVLTAVLTAAQAKSQAPADSGRLVLVVSSTRMLDAYKDERNRERRIGDTLQKVAGAVVSLQSGLMLGTTDDSGSVLASNLPIGRVQLSIRSAKFHPVGCRANVRADRVDTVDVTLLPERKVAVWEKSAGCKQRR